MNRQMTYSEDRLTRIISGPNGTWFYQKKVTEQGTREVDCWVTEIVYTNMIEAKGALQQVVTVNTFTITADNS